MSEEELDELWEQLRTWVDAQLDPEVTEGDWYQEYKAQVLSERFYKLYDHYQDDK